MASAAEIAREMDDGLRRLFQAGLELSLQVQTDAMQAETPRARADLAVAFHRLSRSVRQTTALRVKLAAEAERAGREAAVHAAGAERERRRRRGTQVVQAVLAWAEHETPDADFDELQERLETALETEALYEDFLTDDLDAQVARIARSFGIPVPAACGEAAPKPEAPSAAAQRGPAPIIFDAAPPATAPPYPPSG
jgi:hypothetical protein